MANYVYPAVFHPNEDDSSITVIVPDLPGCITEGKDLADALFMSEDAVSMWLWYAGDSHTPIPAATQPPRTETPEFVNLVRVDLDEYRRKHDSRAVKKTLSIPSWLNAQAEQAGINFSAVLQEALKARLGIGQGSGTR